MDQHDHIDATTVRLARGFVVLPGTVLARISATRFRSTG